MSTLSNYGYHLQPSVPNTEGLCTFVLVDAHGDEVAKIDRHCTLEEAIRAARKFIEEMENN